MRRRTRQALRDLSTDPRQALSIRRSLTIQEEPPNAGGAVARVVTPYYWATYYHDGRGPIRAKPGKFLVYFKDPDRDPRHSFSARRYPERVSDIRRLTKAQFYEALAKGELIVVKRVGPAPAHPFFDVGARGLQTDLAAAAAELLERFTVECLEAEGLLDFELDVTLELF